MSTCELFLGTRHVTIMMAPEGLRTDAIADAFRFTPTQTAHLHLIGVEPLLSAADPSSKMRFVYDGDLGMIDTDALEPGGVYRLQMEDRRAALLTAMDSERREALEREFSEMGAVANMISPTVVIEFFSKQTDLYLTASAPIFAANAELARSVRRTIRETICSQISAILEQDIGNLGTITLETFLAYKAWSQQNPKPSPRPSLRPPSPRISNVLETRSMASFRLQSILSQSRPDKLLSGVWDPNTDVVRSGPLDVKPIKKGSVVEIITDAGADDKATLDEDELSEAGHDDDDDDDEKQFDVVLIPSMLASAMIDGVRHQFVLHSSSGQSINTVYLNVAKRHVVLASKGLLTTRKTVIRFADIRRCDDGAERDALCFSIVTGRRTYHLQTSTARERDVWVAAMNEIVGLEPTKPGPSYSQMQDRFAGDDRPLPFHERFKDRISMVTKTGAHIRIRSEGAQLIRAPVPEPMPPSRDPKPWLVQRHRSPGAAPPPSRRRSQSESAQSAPRGPRAAPGPHQATPAPAAHHQPITTPSHHQPITTPAPHQPIIAPAPHQPNSPPTTAPPARPKYKPYSLQDYKQLPDRVVLGRLGPDLDSEELAAKRIVSYRMQEFSRERRLINLNKIRNAKEKAAVRRRTPPPPPQPKSVSSRQRALEFASRLQLPKPRRPPADGPGRQRSCGPQAVLDEIDQLTRQHEQHKSQVDAIRKEMRLVGIENNR